MTKLRAFDLIQMDPWAILPANLQQILSITEKHSNGNKIDIDAVAAQVGRTLDNTHSVTVRDGVAVIPVTGPIFRFASFFTEVSGATSVEALSKDLNLALEDPTVSAILFDVDSPGGQVSGIQEFSRMIYEARGQKPIVTYSGDSAASAAYWIGSASDKFYAAETARIGSIGVVAVYEDRRQADAADGVQEFKFISSKSPRKQPDPSTEEGASDIQGVVDDLANIFISAVARNRGVTTAKVEADFGQGSVMIAEKALSAGMIDGVSTFEAVLESMTEGNEPKQTATNRVSATVEAGTKQETLNMSDKQEPKAEAITVDRSYLDANHADVVTAIQAESATAERARIVGINEAMIPGHEALAEKAIEEGTAPGAFALQVLGAEKETRKGAVASIKEDAPPVVKIDSDAAPVVLEEDKKDEDLTVAERAEKAWNAEDAGLRDVFAGGKESYIKAFTAEATGKVKLLKK
jgi:signal peptide peptidase SppA